MTLIASRDKAIDGVDYRELVLLACQGAKKLTELELRAIREMSQRDAIWPGLVAASATGERDRGGE